MKYFMTRNVLFWLLLLPLVACKEGSKKEESLGAKVDNGVISFPNGSAQPTMLGLAKVSDSKPTSSELTGRLVWDEERTVRLYPAYAGKVTRILIKQGDHVHAGQTLAMLGSADFGQVQSDAQRSAADFAIADKNLVRARNLFEHGVIAEKELQVAETEREKAQAELRRTRARIELYGGNFTVDQHFALTTPIAGVVVEKNVNPGQELRPDLMTANVPPMFVVSDPAHLWVQLDAGEQDLTIIRKGMVVPLRSSAYPGEVFSAVIQAISDSVDPTTRTVKVRGSVDNPTHKLKGEMFVAALIEHTAANALQVPAVAVFLKGEQHFVFVKEQNGNFVRRQVTVGTIESSTATILSGLHVGETVVTSGNLLLQQLVGDASAS
jgi:membrane fusion protein, heavy metal efflux system